ncbi:hypothetical protein [Pseudodesulfovibrio pelocollis]|uniref:hypothetical protein n=1 Tax=Pseudodesulfovibrio pelocollis TaxID=3051432 RepID=UPI00255B0DB0|nr:hypothetical protein [Pseudodesulfovibrio sp. SB368]
MKPPALTDAQKIRLSILRKQLLESCAVGDVVAGRKAIADLKPLLIRTGHHTKYHELLLHYCETLILKKEYQAADSLLLGILKNTNDNTRIHQEASVLLSICKLHNGDIKSSELYLRNALHSTAIKGLERRKEFLHWISKRFEEESLLVSFGENPFEINTDAIVAEIQNNFISNVSAKQLLENIGNSVPPKSIDFMKKIYEMAKNQLPHNEKPMLPPALGSSDSCEVGKRVFDGISRRIWMKICPRNSGMRQSLSCLQDPKIVSIAILTEIASQGYGLPVNTMLASLTAYILKISLNKYCDEFKPEPLMRQRYKREGRNS